MGTKTKITVSIILCILTIMMVVKMAFAEETQIDYIVEEGTFTVECDEECQAEYWVLNNLVKDVWNEEHDEEFYDFFWDYVKIQTSMRLLSTKYNVEQFKK